MKHSEVNWTRLIDLGKRLVGKPYRLGAEVSLNETDPDRIKEIDCSELVEWLYAQIGLSVPDGSYNQAKVVRRLEFGPPPAKDSLLIGDLGFKWNPDNRVVHHVGVFIGEGQVLEAKGTQWGVVTTPFDEYISSSHFAYWGRLRTIEDA